VAKSIAVLGIRSDLRKLGSMKVSTQYGDSEAFPIGVMVMDSVELHLRYFLELTPPAIFRCVARIHL